MQTLWPRKHSTGSAAPASHGDRQSICPRLPPLESVRRPQALLMIPAVVFGQVCRTSCPNRCWRCKGAESDLSPPSAKKLFQGRCHTFPIFVSPLLGLARQLTEMFSVCLWRNITEVFCSILNFALL